MGRRGPCRRCCHSWRPGFLRARASPRVCAALPALVKYRRRLCPGGICEHPCRGGPRHRTQTRGNGLAGRHRRGVRSVHGLDVRAADRRAQADTWSRDRRPTGWPVVWRGCRPPTSHCDCARRARASSFQCAGLPSATARRTWHRCVRADPVLLERERDNPYDANAIQVLLADGRPLGYVARDAARGLAGHLDDDRDSFTASVRRSTRQRHSCAWS